MIITILPSSANFHAIAYNEMKVEKGVATLLEAQNILGLRPEAYTPEKLRQYFLDYSARNTYVRNAQFHVAVSCKGNEYTHEQLLDIAHRYLKEMGYAEAGQPLLAYAHHDTGNNHIHIVTSRVAPDGHKIDHNHEKRRSRAVTLEIMKEYTGQKQEPEVNDIAKDALSYRYTSKAQFCAIMESLGYECKEDDEKPVVHLYRNGEEQGTIRAELIMQYALKENKPDDKRRRQLRAILEKYRNLSANKEELATHMKRKFGISLVFVGKADTPYGYIVVDHKNKTVFKGGEFLSIKELLQFEDAPTRFTKIEQTIDGLLTENPKLTTADINRILYRQFGTRIHRGTVTWNGETINLRESIVCQLHDNYLESKGIVKVTTPVHPKAEQKPQPSSSVPRHSSMDNNAGSKDANREYEVGKGMNVNDVDDEQSQQAKWRR
ncbi:relaxase/mobilization nuclease domain-containing protein [Prevotella sp. AGR2160]|uniref:relaxase/mobilization nuclease domain-containing protein n=1 Tax=Prevotella sp. AGR2160 TaxID=1280674 RepID=UPI00041FB57A|nr:relaxase/mobilization nuclease domain-containing protein [Prevotella sp. AGR2160]